MKFKSRAATHVGMVRKLNEDSMIERTDIGVWAVADGMGGHAAGDHASQTVTEYVRQLEAPADFEQLAESLQQCLEKANHQLVEEAQSYEDNRVPGSTAVVLGLRGSKGIALWIGDSRIYRRRDNQLTQLTRDHSHVQELVDMKMIRPEEAESHPMANIITRAMGISEPLETESRLINVQPGDQFLLCSDGLTRLLSTAEIESIMGNNDDGEIVQSLLHTALVRGAPDNVTLIHVQSLDGGEAPVAPGEEETVIQEVFRAPDEDEDPF